MEGKKFDQGKRRKSLIPPGVLNEVMDVLEAGALKYSKDNWKNVEDPLTRYYDACDRHIESWWGGEVADPETGKSHLAHAICCLLFLLWFEKNTPGGSEEKDSLVRVSGVPYPVEKDSFRRYPVDDPQPFGMRE